MGTPQQIHESLQDQVEDLTDKLNKATSTIKEIAKSHQWRSKSCEDALFDRIHLAQEFLEAAEKEPAND